MLQMWCSIVSSMAAVTRLLSDGVKWAVKTVREFGHAVAASGSNSGVLAKQYNAQEYKCVNGYSGRWVNDD
ncbi:hypothetical protein I4U23_016622 [Adineta vaga]|nr:hypothetical protein I4U23_016622 [Adineta vaga]